MYSHSYNDVVEVFSKNPSLGTIELALACLIAFLFLVAFGPELLDKIVGKKVD